MKIGLRKSHRGYAGYIRGTQPIRIHYNDIKIFLFDIENKQIMLIKKSGSYESAKKDLNELNFVLHLDII